MKLNKKVMAHPVLVSSVVLILLVTAGLFAYFGLTKTASFDYVKAENRDLTEKVFTNGEVKSSKDVDASFEISGKVLDIMVSVGDKVYEGQPLIKLVSDDESVGLNQAKAALASAKSQFDITKTQSTNAGVSLDEARKNLNNKISVSYTAADDAIRNNIDTMFSNPRTATVDFLLSVNNSELTNDINNERVDIESRLEDWNKNMPSITADDALANLDKINSFLDSIAYGVNGLDANSGLNPTTLTQYKLIISSARASINNTITNLLTSEVNFTQAQSAYNLSVQQVTRSNPDQMSSGEAQIAQAQANVDKAQVQLDKTVLRAPFTGIINSVDAKIGQTVSPSIYVLSMISNGDYQIDSYVSEIDVAKLKVGQEATTTLDAYGSDVPFTTKIISIAPAETIQKGVASYQITLQFENMDQRIRSGMNSNSYILVDSKQNVLTIPKNSIIKKGGDQYVMVYSNKNQQELKKIETGIVGDDYIEVASGLSEGDLIANFN